MVADGCLLLAYWCYFHWTNGWDLFLENLNPNYDDKEHKEIEIIHGLFVVIAMYCQVSSSQFQSITQPPTLLTDWEEGLGSNSLETTYILFKLP